MNAVYLILKKYISDLMQISELLKKNVYNLITEDRLIKLKILFICLRLLLKQIKTQIQNKVKIEHALTAAAVKIEIEKNIIIENKIHKNKTYNDEKQNNETENETENKTEDDKYELKKNKSQNVIKKKFIMKIMN